MLPGTGYSVQRELQNPLKGVINTLTLDQSLKHSLEHNHDSPGGCVVNVTSI